jgi:hypothetical protein
LQEFENMKTFSAADEYFLFPDYKLLFFTVRPERDVSQFQMAARGNDVTLA